MLNNDRRLTPRQRAFIAAYLVSLNATKAAIEAGYSEKTARSQGQRLLTDADIAAAIEVEMKARAERTGINQDRVLHELARIGFLDIGKAFDADGNLLPIHEMDEDVRRTIAGLEIIALRDSEGEQIGTLKKVKIACKLSALEKIGKHLGLFKDRVEVSGDAENPLTLLIKQVQGASLKPVRESVWGGDEPEDDA